MRDFESGFATLFNKRHHRDGPLFRGRYKPVVVELESHAWELSRYVHLNPVRAGLTDDPQQYKWSSYRFYLNPAGAPAWLDWKTVLSQFGGTESQARLAYKRFVEAGMSDPPANPLDNAVNGWILGSPQFVEQILEAEAAETVEGSKEPLTVDQVVAAVANVFEVPAERVRCRGCQGNAAREAAILLARELTSETIVELGAKFGGVGGSTVTETARRARQHAKTDDLFRQRLERLWRELRR